MERTISQEERIRRAEEVYNKRKQNNYNTKQKYAYVGETTQSKLDIKTRLTRKMLLQVLACMIIYLVLYALQNSNYFFSQEIHSKINDFLSYDMQFSNLYDTINSYLNSTDNPINKLFNSKLQSQGIVDNSINNDINNDVNATDNITNEETQNVADQENDQGSNVVAEGGSGGQISHDDKAETETDSNYIKQNYNIIWPLKGVITSKYGTRQATNIVTANHYGIDIAGNTGNPIIAATDGTVTLTSLDGDYGQHLQISDGDISTLYAHCSKLCVQQGANVKQGDKIAEVGQTGRATGPHLHFEIRRDNRTLDPESVLGEM